MRKWFWLPLFLLVPVLVVTALFIARRPTHTFSGLVQSPAVPAPDFTLTDETGRPFALSELRGQWVLLTYGYTTCPDVCPATLAILRQTRALLDAAEAEQVRVVFVSIDPERDSPAVMQAYVRHFGDDVKGLTGTPAEVAVAAQAYGVQYEKRDIETAVGYLVNHSAYVYLIDPDFRWRVTFPFGVPAQALADDVIHLMRLEAR